MGGTFEVRLVDGQRVQCHNVALSHLYRVASRSTSVISRCVFKGIFLGAARSSTRGVLDRYPFVACQKELMTALG
jgi:hypothetical protein